MHIMILTSKISHLNSRFFLLTLFHLDFRLQQGDPLGLTLGFVEGDSLGLTKGFTEGALLGLGLELGFAEDDCDSLTWTIQRGSGRCTAFICGRLTPKSNTWIWIGLICTCCTNQNIGGLQIGRCFIGPSSQRLIELCIIIKHTSKYVTHVAKVAHVPCINRSIER